MHACILHPAPCLPTGAILPRVKVLPCLHQGAGLPQQAHLHPPCSPFGLHPHTLCRPPRSARSSLLPPHTLQVLPYGKALVCRDVLSAAMPSCRFRLVSVCAAPGLHTMIGVHIHTMPEVTYNSRCYIQLQGLHCVLYTPGIPRAMGV